MGEIGALLGQKWDKFANMGAIMGVLGPNYGQFHS